MPSSSPRPTRRGPVATLLTRLSRWLGPHTAVLVTGLVGSLVLALVTWVGSEIHENLQRQGWLVRLDRPILDWMIAHRSPGLDHAVTVWTTIGGPIVTPVVALAVCGILAWRWRSWPPLVLLVIASAGALAVTIVGKNYVARVRPPHGLAVAPYEFSPSFPSGHALNSLVIGGVIAYLLWRRWHGTPTRVALVVVTGLYTFLMGLSRIHLGHHWTSDVLCGWALGAAWLALVITVHSLGVELKEHHALEAASREADAPLA